MSASDYVCKIAVAKNRNLRDMARGISSVRASEIGLPVSTDSRERIFSSSRSIKSAIRSRKRERSAAEICNYLETFRTIERCVLLWKWSAARRLFWNQLQI